MYSFRAHDGKVYGPVPFATLQQWAQQGRILPTSTLIEQATGKEMLAAELPGLFAQEPPAGGWAEPPQQSPYPRQTAPQYGNPPELGTGWTYFGIGAFGCLCCALLSWIFFPLAIVNANKVLARGDGRGQTLKVLSIVFLILSVVAVVLNAMFRFFWLPDMFRNF
jgi:hypothetical protein